ncbi:MAG: hydrogenase maturation nickel metallochaperone HypA [Armatimonadota bacterium]|nr:hydrogenase maturation nickel metallochaperone HypA [Armatimonadota bacterium]MDR5702345.1 hydrogenase maturation nickel metallochaperone HypA [Armatimonadota bacterium]MDR7434882.1 hydrogenase maturation nickel metallochaperone HypA [Armatimonadota bacterium]
MHELGLTEDILATALETAQRAGAQAISRLVLVLSSASHIDPEVVRTHFASISRGTLAEGAELVFRTRTIEQACMYCGRTFVVDSELACPQCGTPVDPHMLGGEMTLESIEVVTPGETPGAHPVQER